MPKNEYKRKEQRVNFRCLMCGKATTWFISDVIRAGGTGKALCVMCQRLKHRQTGGVKC